MSRKGTKVDVAESKSSKTVSSAKGKETKDISTKSKPKTSEDVLSAETIDDYDASKSSLKGKKNTRDEDRQAVADLDNWDFDPSSSSP